LKGNLSGLLVAFIMLLSGAIMGFILYFITARNRYIRDNKILEYIIGCVIFGLVYFILMMLFRPLLGINYKRKAKRR
jgi:uncharacterized membrane protein